MNEQVAEKLFFITHAVIPAQAGIRFFRNLLDAGSSPA